ncbi:MAG: T9SS type A sorting domain-containing protein, partial [Bacteroidota bacterium]
NTNADPVNSQIVNILLSTDNGFTYPDTLMLSTDNDGEAWVKFPDILSTTARVQVQAADNIFFNISPSNFTIADIALDPPTDFVAITDEQTEVTLTWTDIATNEDVYIIMKSVGGTAPYEVIDSVAANVTTYVDQNEVFVAGQSSSYRIFAKNSQTTSCFVEAGYFPVGVEDLSSTWSTAVYPNPSEGLFRIDVRAPHNGALTVDVLDAYGRIVRSEVVQKNQEFWQHTMDIQGMANGIYTVRLRMDQQAVAVRQLVKF